MNLSPRSLKQLCATVSSDTVIDAFEVIGSRELSELSGVPLSSVRGLWGMPPPAGKPSRKNYWWRRDIEDWLVERQDRGGLGEVRGNDFRQALGSGSMNIRPT